MIRPARRTAASSRPMARRVDARNDDARRTAAGHGLGRVLAAVSPRRVITIAAIAGLAFLAAVGVMSPQPVAGVGHSNPSAAATAAAAAASTGSVWDTGSTGGMDWIGLVTKCLLVVVLLFITLRVLQRMQTAQPKKTGRMQVLESRPLAPKASLHLVAIGDRRLVIGLTPSGMVSLAELDSGELDAAVEGDSENATDDDAAFGSGRPATPAAAPIPNTFGAAMAAVSAPIDALTGRLAGLFGGGRVR